MINFRTKLSLILTLLICAPGAAAQDTPGSKTPNPKRMTKVLLLATYHFEDSALDSFSSETDGVLSDRRQDELGTLLDQISRFEPSKVIVELPRTEQSKTAASYARFVQDDTDLPGSEIYQVGFRLARLMGNETIYGVDENNDWYMDRVAAFALANGQQSIIDELSRHGEQVTKQQSEFLLKHTLTENFVQVNQPSELLANQRIYVDYLARIGKDDNHIGADLVADWYKRNIKIFANITRIAKPGERVLVLYGQGHIPILKQLFRDASDFELVDPLRYLTN